MKGPTSASHQAPVDVRKGTFPNSLWNLSIPNFGHEVLERLQAFGRVVLPSRRTPTRARRSRQSQPFRAPFEEDRLSELEGLRFRQVRRWRYRRVRGGRGGIGCHED